MVFRSIHLSLLSLAVVLIFCVVGLALAVINVSKGYVKFDCGEYYCVAEQLKSKRLIKETYQIVFFLLILIVVPPFFQPLWE